LGWSSISMASITTRSMYRALVTRMEVQCNWMRCHESTLCSGRADLSGCSSRMCCWCLFNLVSTERPVWPMLTLPHSQEILYTPGILSPKLSLTGRRRLEMFLWGTHQLDAVSGQYSADSADYEPNIWQQGD
jgi:hypothetical protein